MYNNKQTAVACSMCEHDFLQYVNGDYQLVDQSHQSATDLHELKRSLKIRKAMVTEIALDIKPETSVSDEEREKRFDKFGQFSVMGRKL